MINIKRYVDINSASSSASSSSSSGSGSCGDCASQTDFNNFKDLVNKQFFIVDDEITELNAEQVLQEAEIKQLQIQIKQLGGGHYGFASYADAAAATLPVNSVVEVYGDHGTHTDPVSGATVSNSGTFIVVDKGLQFVMGETITDIEKGYTTKNGNDEADITPGLVIYYDGTEKTGLDNWSAYFLKVKKDDVITYSGTVGSSQKGEVIMYIGQMDSDKNFIAPLAEYTSTGSQTDTATLVGTATQDGYAYVRIRVSGIPVSYTLLHYAKTFVLESDIDIAGGVASYESVAKIIKNEGLQDVTTSPFVDYVTGEVLYYDGTKTETAGDDWKAAYLQVKKGDTIQYIGIIGSAKVDEEIMYIGQLDANKKFVAPLAEYKSTGKNVQGTITGTATQDGYAYVRVRAQEGDTDETWTINATEQTFATYSQYYDLNERVKTLESNLIDEDITTSDLTDYVTGLVIYYDGTQTTSAGDDWKAAFIPVKKGDTITYSGIVGSGKSGEVIMYIGQLDADKNFVAPISEYTSTGANVQGTITGAATQDGYVYVRVRAQIGDTDEKWTIEKDGAKYALQDDLFRLQEKVNAIPSQSAKVFEAPYHIDLSSLPERNPSFAGMDSPLNYTFMKQWARRDWYNNADSFMLSKMSLDENPFNSKSNIYDITSGNVFSYAWSLGKVTFSKPTANGRIVMFADRYVSIGVSEIAIDKIEGNATIGIMFADVDQSNSISVRVSNSKAICEAYVSGKIVNSTNFTCSDMSGSVLKVQNTGTSLIITKLNLDGSWEWIGSYVHSTYLDARKLEYFDTWKTYVFSQTDEYSDSDTATFSGYSHRIGSGANSVSIRFLTYEDGTFIQRGDWLYYLVEGTGTSINDLFTQIVRLNLNSGEVQMIGVILQVRTDGTDEDIVLSDDSIKAVYDRNSKTWKGVSCGMEYYKSGSEGTRPKLYFETKQDLFQGGIILVKNSVQMKNSDGTEFGVEGSASGYVEDIDFFYDSTNKQWVLTGNSVTSGCKTFRSTTLYDGISQEYKTAEVPSGVRDTGNQFVKFDSATYLTSGGSANKLHLRSYEKDLPYLGELKQDVYLDPNTVGPWCTLVPYTNGDETSMYLLSFDRSDLYGGKPGAATYDHGGLYCWKAVKTSS